MYDLHHQRLHSFTCIDSTFILVAQINVKWTVCVDRQYIYKYFTYYVTISAYITSFPGFTLMAKPLRVLPYTQHCHAHCSLLLWTALVAMT